MASSGEYTYTPLTNARNIRVLTLRSALVDSQHIICSLQQVSLDDDPGVQYEALSYTWGAKHGTIPITCDGRTLLVTPNCESALRHLRMKLTGRTLWIDAICIDQKSVPEKNVQVPLMGDVYRLATRAVIWLGPGLPGDSGTLVRARMTGRMVYTRHTPGRPVLSEVQKSWAAKVMSMYPTHFPLISSTHLLNSGAALEEIERVRRICGNDWFQRIWTMQELFLADSAVFLLGRRECPSSALYTYFLIAEALMGADSRERRLFRMRSSAFEEVTPDATAKAGWLMSDTSTRNASPESKAVDFLCALLHMAALNDATDVRDKVYGMVALLDETIQGVVVPEVDYSRPAPEVFEDFARCMVRTTMTLWPLEVIVTNKSTDLPSWVPDLRDPAAVAATAWWSGVFREPPHDVEVKISESVVPGQLPVRGRFLADVIQVYTRMPTFDVGADADSARSDCLSEWMAIADELDQSLETDVSPPVEYYKTALEKLTQFLEYIRERHTPPPQEDPPTTPPSKAKQRDRTTPQRTKAKRDQMRFDDQYDGACLFYTVCGLVGLCKGDVQVGDRVTQLAGGRYPFVLRRVHGTGAASKCCRLVGVADVHGLASESRKGGWQTDLIDDRLSDMTLV